MRDGENLKPIARRRCGCAHSPGVPLHFASCGPRGVRTHGLGFRLRRLRHSPFEVWLRLLSLFFRRFDFSARTLPGAVFPRSTHLKLSRGPPWVAEFCLSSLAAQSVSGAKTLPCRGVWRTRALRKRVDNVWTSPGQRWSALEVSVPFSRAVVFAACYALVRDRQGER